jgi:hypothetical protein
MDPAGAYFDHEQYVQAPQEDRVEVEEVAGQQPVGLSAEECLPRGVRISWRGAQPVGAQDPPDGRVAEPVAQAQQFAVDSAIPPPWVLSREPRNQLANLLVW